MSETETFQHRLVTARRAAWQVLLAGVGLQMFAYFFYLGLGQSGMEGLAHTGLYGDISPSELSHLSFLFIAALKLMNIAIFMVALFLTLWARGLSRSNK